MLSKAVGQTGYNRVKCSICKLQKFSFQKGWLHLSHIAWDLPSKIRYWRKDRRIEVKGGRGKRDKQLLGDLKEMKRYFKLQQKAADRTVLGTRFCRGYGPVATEVAEWMNGVHNGITSCVDEPTRCTNSCK